LRPMISLALGERKNRPHDLPLTMTRSPGGRIRS
jgi:hypothetical protein